MAYFNPELKAVGTKSLHFVAHAEWKFIRWIFIHQNSAKHLMNEQKRLIYGNKMPTRCNRGFLLQILLLAQHVSVTIMPIIRSSRVSYSGCCLCCSIPQTGHTTHSSTPDRQLENQSTKYHRQQPLYDTLELLMMGIMVPETC